MSTALLLRYSLLLLLVAFPAQARDMEEKLTIRTLKVPAHPSQQAPSIYVSGQVVTALRFESEINPKKTKLLAWEGRFETPLVGGKKVVLEPLRDLDDGEALPLLVTLVDGTEFTFLVKPRSRKDWGWIDYQVNVFKDHDSYNAVLSSLYDSLKRERDLREENERFKNEENSVDHAYAALLAHGLSDKTPFRRKRFWQSKNEDMDVKIELFEGPGKAAAIIHLKNTYYGEQWVFDGASLTRDLTSDNRLPFALRMERAVLLHGQSGRFAVVADKKAFETDGGQLADLVFQIFRDDGLLQVMVNMDHTLVQR